MYLSVAVAGDKYCIFGKNLPRKTVVPIHNRNTSTTSTNSVKHCHMLLALWS